MGVAVVKSALLVGWLVDVVGFLTPGSWEFVYICDAGLLGPTKALCWATMGCCSATWVEGCG